jgi:hypothetical protein
MTEEKVRSNQELKTQNRHFERGTADSGKACSSQNIKIEHRQNEKLGTVR